MTHLKQTTLSSPPPLGELEGGRIIIITLPSFFEGETTLVNSLFEHGMQRLHLRKPGATEQEMAEWIEHIAPPHRRHIVLHDHHRLALRYGLGGVHLNARNPSFILPPDDAGTTLTISRSCHSLEEVVEHKSACDYLFLSPIYDSISKEGYGSTFSKEDIAEARSRGIIDGKVYALGGVRFDCLHEIESMGFGGAAILGDLWLSPSPLERLDALSFSSMHGASF